MVWPMVRIEGRLIWGSSGIMTAFIGRSEERGMAGAPWLWWGTRRERGSGRRVPSHLGACKVEQPFVSVHVVSDPLFSHPSCHHVQPSPRAGVGTLVEQGCGATGQMGVQVHKQGTPQMPHSPRTWGESIFIICRMETKCGQGLLFRLFRWAQRILKHLVPGRALQQASPCFILGECRPRHPLWTSLPLHGVGVTVVSTSLD